MTQTLITRLSKLDAPDREVDAELEAVSLGGRVYLNDPESKEVIIERPIDGFWIRGIYPYRKIARYTASVDAAIALAARVLPGWRVENLCEWEDETLRSRGPWTCDLRKNGENFFSPLKGKCGHAPSPAIALCIALLRAKEASK